MDVFSLLQALWGDRPLHEEGAWPTDPDSYYEQSYRRRQLSSWLAAVNRRREIPSDKGMNEVCKILMIK